MIPFKNWGKMKIKLEKLYFLNFNDFFLSISYKSTLPKN